MGAQTKKCCVGIVGILSSISLLGGLLLVGGGSFLVWSVNQGNIKNVAVNEFFNSIDVPSFTLVTGIAVVAVGVIGYVVVYFSFQCLLIVFALLLTCLVGMEIALLIQYSKISGEKTLDDSLFSLMNKSMQKYKDREEYYVEAWETMQQTFKCCGIYGAYDWIKRNMSIPIFCFNRKTDFYAYIQDFIQAALSSGPGSGGKYIDEVFNSTKSKLYGDGDKGCLGVLKPALKTATQCALYVISILLVLNIIMAVICFVVAIVCKG